MSAAGFDELLRRLVDAEVRFVLVGGLALNAWGVVRGTKDVDVVCDPTQENVRRLAETVVALDGQVQTRDSFVSSRPSIEALVTSGERVLVETSFGPLDVVQGLPGVPPYSELLERAEEVDVLGTIVSVCSLADLRAMKRAAGRTRDLADLEDLDAVEPES